MRDETPQQLQYSLGAVCSVSITASHSLQEMCTQRTVKETPLLGQAGVAATSKLCIQPVAPMRMLSIWQLQMCAVLIYIGHFQ